MSSPRGGRVLGVQFISMPTVRLDALQISDWDSFHSVFATSFGFPSFYGRNMNAWIDCMTYLDADDGMTTVHGSAADPVVIRLDNARTMPKELFDALVECAGFVNLRRLELGEPAMELPGCAWATSNRGMLFGRVAYGAGGLRDSD